MKCLALLVLLFSTFSIAHAQPTDSLAISMARYGFSKTPDLLFVHTDKHIYTNNEFVWFSAYLLQTKTDSIEAHRFLSLVLVQAGTRQPVLHQKFVIVRGLSHGSLRLPDSIAPGAYKLLCYTNIMGGDSLPVALFAQDLAIRAIHQAEFMASVTVENDSIQRQTVVITVRDKNTMIPIRDADLLLWIGHNKAIPGTTNKSGLFRYLLPVPTAGTTSPPTINARVKYKSDLAYLQTQLPAVIKESELVLQFYPEGGNLLHRAHCTIGWESKTENGEPLAVKAVLYRNDIPIDTIRTDESGLGRFSLVPDTGARYYVQVNGLPAGIRSKAENYVLPPAVPKGITLHLPAALAGDSLSFRMYAAGYQQVKMIVHNFRSIFAAQQFTVKPEGAQVLLLLDQFPKGLMAITLLDSLDRPLAERIFFAHYNAQVQVQLTPGKKTYEKREKVTLQFQLSNTDSAAISFASVSCAQANRFENGKQQDIESFAFLQQELQRLPPYAKDRGFNDPGYLEQVLLVRGWRRYHWKEMAMHNARPPAFYSPSLSGMVQGIGKIRKPIQINLLGGAAALSTITTDERGRFTLGYDDVLVPQDNKLLFFAGQKGTSEGHVAVTDPFMAINNKLALHTDEPVVNAGRFLPYSRDLVLPDFDKVNYLAQVTVTARTNRDQSIYGAANSCGDYVCPYNILNCSNHPGLPTNRLPVKGKSYGSRGGGQVVYWGCVLDEPGHEPVSQYDGIKIGKEFYPEDFSNKTDGIPEYISTLYWSPMLVFDKTGKAECHFYTGDITGRFRIVVNGVANNNLFYGMGVFDVK
jgi:hypothetical protein